MTNTPYTDHPYVYAATDTVTIGTPPDEGLITAVSNAMAASIDSYIVDSISASEMHPPVPVIVYQHIETCKYDADSRTLFAFVPLRDTLSYPKTQTWPDELRLTRYDTSDIQSHGKVVLVAPRVISVWKQQEMEDDTYSLYRDEANDAWVRLYESEKLRDYYFAMYRATKKNPYP